MSIYHRTYLARFAPSSTTPRTAIRGGIDVVGDDGLETESFESLAFTGTDPKRVAVLLGHDTRKIVGWVTQLSRSRGWHICAFTLDHSRTLSAVALDRLHVGAPISIGFDPIHANTRLAELGVKQHTLAKLNEVSILARDERPAYPGAQVVSIIELPRAARSHAPVREHPDARGGTLVRPNTGYVLGVS